MGGFAVDPSDPATVYVATAGGMWRSTDAGGNWTARSAGMTSFDVGTLAIAPSSPATVYAETIFGGAFRTDEELASTGDPPRVCSAISRPGAHPSAPPAHRSATSFARART